MMEKSKEDLSRPGLQVNMNNQPEVIKKTYRGSEKLKGKTALITGGDSGIGRSVAVHFAKEGANVAITYLNETVDANLTRELVEKEGSRCSIMAGDLKDFDFCKKLVESVLQEFGQIDILVNNAGTQFEERDFTKISVSDLRTTFELNILAMIFLTQQVLPQMKSGSRIINTTSITGYRGHETLVDYASTKGAVTSFTRALSQQLASRNILVNGVAPGPIWTPLIPATMEDIEDFGEYTPLGRCGQPSEVAPAYVYLASEDSTYMTGQILHINGGEVVGG